MDSARVKAKIWLHPGRQHSPIQTEVYGLKRIGITTPPSTVINSIEDFSGLSLADPEFATPAGVDLILGANVYSQLILPGIQKRGPLLAQNSIFGWIITGITKGSESEYTANAVLTLMTGEEESWNERIIRLLQRFWSVEEIPRKHRLSVDDLECESIYADSHTRDSLGRYVVPLPLKSNALSMLGSSLHIARLALSTQQRRIQRDVHLKQEYIRFMDEYLQLGHMRRLTPQEINDQSPEINYIPHHGIWQRSDNMKKLRVVFNASRQTTSGYSLNEVLHAGPKLQSDLATVASRWRIHKIAFCADIKMMFRQILIRSSDTHLQRIIWSPDPNQPEEHFALLTVTYGETCAPYLALRTLQQLCTDEGDSFPEGVKSIQNELYVDDFLSGGSDLNDARQRRDQLVNLLKKGGFELKKWVSNQQELVEDIPPSDRLRPSWRHFEVGGLVNELGLAWDPVTDEFRFSPPKLGHYDTVTKRKALAELSGLFDPAGWLAPLLVSGKMHIQDLWRAKMSWDEQLPSSMMNRWISFRDNIKKIDRLTLPRWIRYEENCVLQLHVFADASRRAMAAAVYSRTSSTAGTTSTRLLAAKTKLSPIKSLLPTATPTARMTIPRLELRAALLGAKLIKMQAEALNVDLKDCFAWSDSQVVIHWLSSNQPVGNDLVDNYVNHIQELLPGIKWRYVPSDNNPADLATRGVSTESLSANQLWWQGPPWLQQGVDMWPKEFLLDSEATQNLERQTSLKCCTTQTSTSIIDRFSSFLRLLRCLVRCRRLLQSRITSDESTPPLAPMTTDEINKEFLTCVKIAQEKDFAVEMQHLAKKGIVHDGSSTARLKPFLDEQNILRVGGRLQHSFLCDEEKHPPILDGRSHLAGLIIDWAHQKALHAGQAVTFAYLMKRVWIIGGRARVKSFVRRCLVCSKISGRPSNQLMADLPAVRVQPSRPFSKVGVDYAGPFQILRSKGRGISSSKGYVAVFVCLATKAIHLELVGDLTTESFLGTLARFVGRRGRPLEIWSDNATNFRGADLELRRLLLESKTDYDKIKDSLAQDQIMWQFIPPSAPHFGGLWEAGVKSMKNHLRRVANSGKLTYEEFSTLLVEIEMVLNSRPMVPLTGDLDDLDVLTPGHFLIGTALTSIPQPSLADENLERLTHWKLMRGLRDQFWRRWSLDYLNTLQQRAKWTRPRPNLKVGDLVMIMDPSLMGPHGRWPLGRILQAHEGPDQLVRVATIKTSNGIYTRPITKLVQLPAIEKPNTTVDEPETAGGAE